MADKIKKFWEKKKTEAKFKMAGPGHKLNEAKPNPARQKQRTDGSQIREPRAGQSDESKQAAAAALARLGGTKHDAPAFNTSMAAIQAQVKRELEAEKAAAAASAASETSHCAKSEVNYDSQLPLALAVQGVYYRCPLISEEILPKEDWKQKIKEFLYEQLAEEQGLTACLIIHSCNKNRDKVNQCVETLCKYLENIIQHPDDIKYRRIKTSNRVFMEKVAGMEGVSEFLEAAGFVKETLPDSDNELTVLVYPDEKLCDIDTLVMLMDALQTAEPIGLQLDRNLQVLSPNQAATRKDLPQEFFKITPEELKREQQLKTELVENSLILRTKAMREREEQRELKKYRFALIRVRFPDGVLIQGTFGVYEHLSEVNDFVKETLSDDLNFILITATGQKLSDEDYEKSLIDLKLVPASVLTFTVANEKGLSHNFESTDVLRPDILLRIQDL